MPDQLEILLANLGWEEGEGWFNHPDGAISIHVEAKAQMMDLFKRALESPEGMLELVKLLGGKESPRAHLDGN